MFRLTRPAQSHVICLLTSLFTLISELLWRSRHQRVTCCIKPVLKISSTRLLMSSTKPNSGVPEFLRIDNMSANEYVSTDFFLTFEFLCQFSACQSNVRDWHTSGAYVSYFFNLFSWQRSWNLWILWRHEDVLKIC